MDENESLESLFHRDYDPVKRHQYYERTKKLKGRKKGLSKNKPLSVKQLRRRAMLSRPISSIPPPVKVTRGDKPSEDILTKAANTSLAEAKERLRKKQEAEALVAKRFALENKRLDLESSKLDLDSQQTELEVRAKNLIKLKNKPGIDRAAWAQEDRQIKLAQSKLAIQRKKFDLEVQKLDEELKKLSPQPSNSTVSPHLVHEYDPVKRHEYYERTKKLKGRSKGASQTSGTKSSQNNGSGGARNPKEAKNSEQQKAEIKARVTAYKARLEKLKEVLALLVAEAKKRSEDNAGTKESRAEAAKKESASKEKSSSDGGSKKSGSSTAKEKAASKEYYEKNKDKISLKKQEANLKDQIKEVEEKIVKIRADLKDSIQKARDKAAKHSNK